MELSLGVEHQWSLANSAFLPIGQTSGKSGPQSLSRAFGRRDRFEEAAPTHPRHPLPLLPAELLPSVEEPVRLE